MQCAMRCVTVFSRQKRRRSLGGVHDARHVHAGRSVCGAAVRYVRRYKHMYIQPLSMEAAFAELAELPPPKRLSLAEAAGFGLRASASPPDAAEGREAAGFEDALAAAAPPPERRRGAAGAQRDALPPRRETRAAVAAAEEQQQGQRRSKRMAVPRPPQAPKRRFGELRCIDDSHRDNCTRYARPRDGPGPMFGPGAVQRRPKDARDGSPRFSAAARLLRSLSESTSTCCWALMARCVIRQLCAAASKAAAGGRETKAGD